MKLYKAFSMLFVGLAMTACSNDDIVTEGGETPAGDAVPAYMSLKLVMPSNATRATQDEDPATEDEKTINDVTVVLFDSINKVVQSNVFSSDELNGASPKEAIKVPATTKSVFVVINSTDELSNRIVNGAKFDDINSYLVNTADQLTGNTKRFLMVSAGDESKGTLQEQALAPAKVYKSGVDVTIAQAKEEALKNKTSLKVDRIVAKANVTVNNPKMIKNGHTFDFLSWAFNVTNNGTFPFTQIKMLDADGAIADLDYRIDKNYTAGQSIATDFNYLDVDSYDAAGTAFTKGTKYCAENTMDGANQFEDQVTTVIVAGNYHTDVVPSGSWFRLRKSYIYNFEDLLKAYNDAVAAKADSKQTLHQDQIIAACEAFYKRIKGEATLSATNGFQDLTLALLDGVKNGGKYSKATDAEPNGELEYFQKGLCFYAIPIMHDHNITTNKTTGKYGVVRRASASRVVLISQLLILLNR